jgi:hypothetical protein
MKALSIRQPWAELILQGRKTLELRSWTVKHRGPLAIHASQTVERDLCQAYGIDPDQVAAGAVIGVVELVGIDELDEDTFRAREVEHLAPDYWRGGQLYGWRLANPRRLPHPEPMRGRMGLFEAEVDLTEAAEAPTAAATDAASAGAPGRSERSHLPAPQSARKSGASRNDSAQREQGARTFDLRVQPVAAAGPGEPAYRLSLHQVIAHPPLDQKGLYEGEPAVSQRVAELGGASLRAVAEQVLDALRSNGYRPTELGAGRREPFVLTEESGVRLGLLFLAVRPITRMERIEVISQGIRAMTSEEAYYWYSKCAARPVADRAQKALRVLLAAE